MSPKRTTVITVKPTIARTVGDGGSALDYLFEDGTLYLFEDGTQFEFKD